MKGISSETIKEALLIIFFLSNCCLSEASLQEFIISSDTELDMINPSSSSNSSGLTIVVWQQQIKDELSQLVYANRYFIYGKVINSNGNLVYGPFKVSENPSYILDKFPLPNAILSNIDPDVAINDKGQFVVAWELDDIKSDNAGLLLVRLFKIYQNDSGE